jgi:hypothetical protein
MEAWMIPAVIVLGFILGVAIFVGVRSAVPNMKQELALLFALTPPLIGIITFAAGLFPTQVAAGFDSNWLVLDFRNREFAEAFYECNREVAQLGDQSLRSSP